jgi:hypothetical protein
MYPILDDHLHADSDNCSPSFPCSFKQPDFVLWSVTFELDERFIIVVEQKLGASLPY